MNFQLVVSITVTRLLGDTLYCDDDDDWAERKEHKNLHLGKLNEIVR